MLLFISVSALAQKQVKKTILDPAITLVQIDVSNCFELVMETRDIPEIRVEAQIEGEYREDLELRVYEVANTLMIGAGFNANYINPNDKLSAHKVVSIALHVVVPKWKNINVFGTSARVLASGDYSNLTIVLSNGICELHSVAGEVNVKTQSGTILLATDYGNIDAFSKYGKISGDKVPIGDKEYTLYTVTGNIELRKLE